MIFFVTITIVWFFLYWVIGGVFFACVALLRLIRLRKARFSCLFSLTAALCASAATWGSVAWIERTTSDCFALPQDQTALLVLLSCGWFQFILSALAGFVLLIIIGFGLLKISSWKDRTWLTIFVKTLELIGSDDEENY